MDMYEFKMALFKNGNPEEFLPFVKKFKMTNETSGMLAAKAKLWYLRTILCGKVLTQIRNFVPSNRKHEYDVFKPGHIGFR